MGTHRLAAPMDRNHEQRGTIAKGSRVAVRVSYAQGLRRFLLAWRAVGLCVTDKKWDCCYGARRWWTIRYDMAGAHDL